MLDLKVSVTNAAGNIDTPNGETLVWEGQYDFGDTLEEAVGKFGSEVIFDLAKRMVTTDIQNGMRGVGRRLADRTEVVDGAEVPMPVSVADVESAMTQWLSGYRPGVQRQAAPKSLSQRDVERFFADPSKSKEEKLALVQQLQAQLAAMLG